jgi:ABC-2 type transport system permease protein
MSLIPLTALVRKDLRLFFTDRRSVMLSFVVPIAIASFFGAMFSGASNSNAPAKITVAIINEDDSTIGKAIVASAQADDNLSVSLSDAATARDDVRRGKTTIGVVIPKGFGDAAGTAFFGQGSKPSLQLLYDPSHTMEVAMVRGILTEHVMQAVSKEMFSGAQGRSYIETSLPRIESSNMDPEQKKLLINLLRSVRSFYDQPAASATNIQPAAPGLSLPYRVESEAVTGNDRKPYNGYAHAFGGLAIQFLLFAMANLGIETLVERQRGLWKRLRSAPISRSTLLLGKGLAGALISSLVLMVSFGFAMIVFHVRIEGSLAGFVGVVVASSCMASAFGLLIAAVGKTPGAARGITTLAVLMMVMLGGGWVPTFIFPEWLRRMTVVIPVRWAVDGLDAMTWRGLGLDGALAPIGMLLGFAVIFAALAASQFRWEEA